MFTFSSLVRRVASVGLGLFAATQVGVSQTINPADYGTISLHLKASDLALTNGAQVTNWGGLLSGQVAGTVAPTYVATDARFNNQPVVLFNTSTRGLLVSNTANLNARAIFAVTSVESTAPSLAGLLSTGADKLNVRRNGSTLFYRSPGQGMDANDFAGVITGGNLWVNNVASGAYVNGTPHVLHTTAGALQQYPSLYLGNAGSGLTRYWAGSVAEIIIFETPLTTEGTNRVGWYLQNKYGLAGGYPAPLPSINSLTASTGTVTSSGGVLSPSSGAAITLQWATSVATSVSMDNGVSIPSNSLAGSVVVNPTATTTYTLTATNVFGSKTQAVTVYVGTTPTPPTINEFVADNASGLSDPTDPLAHPDWLEVANPNPFALELEGYRLRNNVVEWDFPAGASVPPNGHLVVYASGKNLTNPANPLHTNFTLDAEGEYLGLVRLSDLAVVSEFSPQYPPQDTDISYGWWATAGGNRFFGKPTGAPTPGAENGPVGVLGFLNKVDDTTFSVKRGFYTSAVTTTVAATTPGAMLIYTTNGSEPTQTNGTQVPAVNATTPPSATFTIHPGALPVGAGSLEIASIGGVTTLRVVAAKPDFAPTNVDTQTYLFSQQVLGQTVTDANTRGWPATSVNGQLFNYGMDANAVAAYSNADMLQSMHSIPTVSIVADMKSWVDPVVGIYSNADQHGGAYERAASVEMILPPGYVSPDGHTTGFQINAGIRIRGGASRGDTFFKHALRLYFNKDYDGRLNYRLFGDEGTDNFGLVDMATSSNYAWYREAGYGTGSQNTMCRDMFCRDTQGALGQPYGRSRFYHMYLNGHYWGIYYSDERPVADFGASYHGGNEDEYDAVKCGNRGVIPNFATEATDGDMVAWTTLWNKCRAIGTQNASDEKFFEIIGCNADGTRNSALPVLLDVDSLITEMLVIFYSGDGDAVLSNFLARNTPNNWFSYYRRNGESGFKFVLHDAEHSLGSSSSTPDQTGPYGGSNIGSLQFSNPQRMHQDLMSSAAYRRRFADHVQRHFFNDGALTTAKCVDRFTKRTSQLRQAMKMEEARWGDAQTITSLPGGHVPRYTVADWETAITNVTNWMAPRSAIVLEQLKNDNLYPRLDPAAMADDATGTPQHGGNVAPAFNLRLTASGTPGSSTIYYTLDGTDPRPELQPIPTLTTLLPASADGFWRVPTGVLSTDGYTPIISPVGASAFAFYALDFTLAPAAGGSVPDSATAVPGDTGAQNGVFVGAPTITTNRLGANSSALSFSGTGQAINLANPVPLQITGQITMAAWVRTTAAPTNAVRNILGKGPTTSPAGEIFMRMNGGDWEIGSWNGTNHLVSYPIYTDLNTWVHLAGVYDGTAWKMYRNGQLVATKVDPVGAVSVTGGWAIGGATAGTSRLWTGQIDDVAIFPVALSEAAIAGLAGQNVADWTANGPTTGGTWTASSGGIGYERDVTGTLDPGITTHIETAMYNVRASVQMRKHLTLTATQISDIKNLVLRLRSDDGYVAYVNGVEVARRNGPTLGTLSGNTAAITARNDADALAWEDIDITNRVGLLQVGDNLIALQGLNTAAADEDFLLNLELAATTVPYGLAGSAQAYTSPIAISQPTTVKTRVFSNGTWSAMDEAVFTVNTEPASAANLVVSQIDYNPLLGNGFEFIELMGISGQNIDLSGVKISIAVDFTFPTGFILPAGGRVQIAGDPAQFTSRFGVLPSLRVMPTGFVGNLSNGGEQIRIVAANGDTIKDFAYDDDLPWPMEADGQGYRLVLMLPASNPNHVLASSWRGSANFSADQAPGASDALVFTGDPGADADGDGYTAYAEFTLGTSDTDATSGASNILLAPAEADPANPGFNYLAATITRAANTDQATIKPEVSTDLATWLSETGLVLVERIRASPASVQETWRTTEPVGTEQRLFLKVNINQP